MTEPLRFYTDENIPTIIPATLNQHNIDTERCQEAGLREATDEQHLQHASATGRVVITRDIDFLRLHARWMAEGGDHSGIVFIPRAMWQDLGSTLTKLRELADKVPASAMRNRVEYLSLR